MSPRPLLALVRKDLQLFFGSRREVLITFITPIALAAFFGFLFSPKGSSEAAKIPIRVVDLDRSAISGQIAAGLTADESLEVLACKEPEAREAVRKGEASVGVVIPAGFGEASARAFFGGGTKPEIGFLYDPSHAAELGMVRGILTQHAMEAVGKEAFNGPTGRRATQDALKNLDTQANLKPEDKTALRDLLSSVDRWQGRQEASRASGEPGPGQGLAVPFAVREEAVTAKKGVQYNSYAHSFAGMGVQFILFAGIEFGVGVLYERRLGLWKRLRSAPLSRGSLLLGRLLSGTIIALTALLVTFAFGMAVFGIRVQGSFLGFLGLCLSSALLASSFGLMLAALGGNPEATRGIAIFATLVLVMLGGAWVPAFIFPAWLQKATLAVPVRWAMDGFDGVTWRGMDLAGALAPAGVLLAFSLLFSLIALWRFRWEE